MMLATLVAAQMLSAAAYTPEALADQVTNLPGAEKLDFTFNQFSGFLTVNNTKQMHYWMVESENDPANDPVAFWTNGGPGCSGLLGMLGEQGPFRPNEDLSLSMNEYAWNKVANMVFVEQPCGVGFSYSTAEDTSADYKHDDDSAANDNYFMIQEFMKRFPEYAENSLYYTSESYGGHYMPTLAKTIVDRNAEGVYPTLNYKGFAVGNPATTTQSTTPAMLQTYWGHQLLPKPTWDAYEENCIDAIIPNATICGALFTDMFAKVRALNPYAIDYPVCTEDSKRASGRAQRNWLVNHLLADATDDMKAVVGLEPVEDYQPCEEDYMTAWLDQTIVQDALHVTVAGVTEWGQCSRDIRYDQRDGSDNMVPYYQYLIDGKFGLNILVYSGDDDAICSTWGTQSWIWDMGYETAGKIWQQYEVDGQTGGYFTEWKDTKFGFLTIHGAGHEVPTYKPKVALDMFIKYLNGDFTSA